MAGKKKIKKLSPDLGKANLKEEEEDFRDDDTSSKDEGAVSGDDKDVSENESANATSMPKNKAKKSKDPMNRIKDITDSETSLKKKTPSEAATVVRLRAGPMNKSTTAKTEQRNFQTIQDKHEKESKNAEESKAIQDKHEKESKNAEESKAEKVDGNQALRFILAFITLCGLIAWILTWNPPTIPLGHSYRDTDEFVKSVEEMKTSFPDQFPEYWRLVRNSGKRHLKKVESQNKQDLRPLSLLIVAFEDSKNIMDCFLKKIGEAYTDKPFESISSNDYIGEDARLRLDEKIKSSLRGNQKFVVVKGIQNLPYDAAELFMTYADEYNDMHHYPQSAIIMSAVLPYSKSGSRKELEKETGTYFLDKLWSDQANINNRAALWTRVGDGIIVLKNEKENPCVL
ncbi:uncharacterized protein [Clytia hemisphaerica]